MFMKNIVLFVMFFGLNLNAQSLESFGLKGNVKSIQEEYKRCSKSNSDADCFPLSSEMKFSKEKPNIIVEYKNNSGSINWEVSNYETHFLPMYEMIISNELVKVKPVE